MDVAICLVDEVTRKTGAMCNNSGFSRSVTVGVVCTRLVVGCVVDIPSVVVGMIQISMVSTQFCV